MDVFYQGELETDLFSIDPKKEDIEEYLMTVSKVAVSLKVRR